MLGIMRVVDASIVCYVSCQHMMRATVVQNLTSMHPPGLVTTEDLR